jgi:hypothetical protein
LCTDRNRHRAVALWSAYSVPPSSNVPSSCSVSPCLMFRCARAWRTTCPCAAPSGPHPRCARYFTYLEKQNYLQIALTFGLIDARRSIVAQPRFLCCDCD